MLKLTLAFLTVFTAAVGPLAEACTLDGKEGIFPENSLSIPESAFGTYAVNEEQFKTSIARAEKIYAPVFAAQGRVYKIFPKWSDGTVNAYAKRNGNVSEVHMFGGLARHPRMTADGFELVICHETGHHLGGAPKTRMLFGVNAWATNEGQSDYFATLKCAREMWKNDDNVALMATGVPATVLQLCQKSFDSANDIAICERGMLAGKALADTLADMNKKPDTDFEKPDPKVVTRMDHRHPDAQCRLDTYMAGAVCAKSKDEALSDTDPTIGTCAQEKGDVLGVRPLCWYMLYDPSKPEPSSTWPSLSRR